MDTITWLHISDLHFRAKQTYDSNIMQGALLKDVAERIQEDALRPDFIAVTGDVAFSGQADEYDVARKFFDDLLKITGLDKERLFVIPGNHDVDRSLITTGARAIGDSLTDRERVNALLTTPSDRQLMFARFKGYAVFVNDYLGGHLHFDDEHYFYVRALDLAGKRVALLGLNSAWLSGSDRERNRLVLGERQVRTALEQAASADVKIALMHNSFDQLRDFDYARSGPLLTRDCDFVLHGFYDVHPMRRRSSSDKAMVIAADVSHRSRGSAKYNFVQLDLATGQGRIFLRRYSDQGGFWTKDTLTSRDAPDGVYTFPLSQEWVPPPEDLPVSVSTLDKVYVEELRLTNFRCFEKETFSLSKEFTVFIGDNASGKTAILEALVIGIGAFFLGVDGFRAPFIETDQARLVRYNKYGHYKYGQTPTSEPQYPVQVSCRGTWGDRELEWTRTRGGQSQLSTDQGAEDIVNLARRLQSQVRQGEGVVLPLIAYYSTGRVWQAPEGRTSGTDEPGSRFRGYEGCLDPASHVSDLIRWMKTQELIAREEEQPNIVLEAVKGAITGCVESLQSISYNIRQGDLYAYFADGQELPFRMLSDGVRNMLAMVADIACRAVLLNPQFGEKAVERTPGIVLIDEIDLHLHPRWQRRVVEDLRRTFPRIQFIATTHSPLIIQSLRPGELVDLEKDPTGEYANRSPEDILEDVQGVDIPQRSRRYQQMYDVAKEYYQLLQGAEGASPEKKDELKRELDELTAPFSDNVAYHAFLEMRRTASGLGDDDDEAD